MEKFAINTSEINKIKKRVNSLEHDLMNCNNAIVKLNNQIDNEKSKIIDVKKLAIQEQKELSSKFVKSNYANIEKSNKMILQSVNDYSILIQEQNEQIEIIQTAINELNELLEVTRLKEFAKSLRNCLPDIVARNMRAKELLNEFIKTDKSLNEFIASFRYFLNSNSIQCVKVKSIAKDIESIITSNYYPIQTVIENEINSILEKYRLFDSQIENLTIIEINQIDNLADSYDNEPEPEPEQEPEPYLKCDIVFTNRNIFDSLQLDILELQKFANCEFILHNSVNGFFRYSDINDIPNEYKQLMNKQPEPEQTKHYENAPFISVEPEPKQINYSDDYDSHYMSY